MGTQKKIQSLKITTHSLKWSSLIRVSKPGRLIKLSPVQLDMTLGGIQSGCLLKPGHSLFRRLLSPKFFRIKLPNVTFSLTWSSLQGV